MPDKPSNKVLELNAVSVMRGPRAILDRLSLTIEVGQHTAILGRNGSGKSTLVKLITRQLYPLGGEGVRIFGEDRWNVAELRGRLGIVSPSMQLDFAEQPSLEVFDAVISGFMSARGLAFHHIVTDEMKHRSHEALARVGVSHLIGRSMHTLSTGEARRVLIARALVHRPEALLLDEPCAGLDPATRRVFLNVLRGLAQEGTTLLLVTHHIEEILPEMAHIVMLDAGRVLHQGAKSDLLTDDVLGDLFDMPVKVSRNGLWYGMQVDETLT
ncbi:MAG: ATP-binding cassette domain-containing protein [Asticcacaulis sp.]